MRIVFYRPDMWNSNIAAADSPLKATALDHRRDVRLSHPSRKPVASLNLFGHCRRDATDWDAEDFKHQDLTRSIIQVFYEVYNELGHGFLESVYEEAMEMALASHSMTVMLQYPLQVWFRGEKIGNFHPDSMVGDAVIVELKAARAFEPAHEAQLLNYLRASDLEVGLLLNFGPVPKIKCMVFGNERKKARLMAADGAESRR